MRPHYDPVGATVPEQSLRLDLDQVYWHGSERFTGFLGETVPSGNYEFQGFRDGVLEGPSGELSPDGDLVFEEWYQRNTLHGITRRFRPDGTLANATGYEYGVAIWTVRFDVDGRTVLSTDRTELTPGVVRSLEMMRADVPLPPLLGPEYAADLNRH
ncbi:toxin-antitoxin system YwqK family antitoxin [Glycomyces artemisiae]|uniref:MORN repeat protein n=1 Tax=Glycomyces artemisiae TaxID=1076443 RepID=A0A2T0UNL9_9ACTN|nr:hypothetical protein [Glycomyces artemisiae]PRY59529.1 hypothetical protein B0I28_1033 [Glycomyces artemisiae]